MLHFKKNLFLTILFLSIYSNAQAAKSQTIFIDNDWGSPTEKETSKPTEADTPPDSTPPINHESLLYRDNIEEVIYDRYFNYDTQNYDVHKTVIYLEPNPADLNTFDLPNNTSSESNTVDVPTNESLTPDYFNDFTLEQRREQISETENEKLAEKNSLGSKEKPIIRSGIISEKEFAQDKERYFSNNREYNSDQLVKNIKQVYEIENTYSSAILTARFKRLKSDYDNQFSKRTFHKPQKIMHEKEVAALDALLSGKIASLCADIQRGDLATAQAAFNEAQNIWGWKRDYTFLIPNLTSGTSDSSFNARLGFDQMHIMERHLITRPDFIQAYTDQKSYAKIQDLKKQCSLLQQKSQTNAFYSMRQELYETVVKNGRNTNIADNICLAVVEKALQDPINTVLSRIKHARSIEIAQLEKNNFEQQILNHMHAQNITHLSDIRAKIIEQYDFDALELVQDTYHRHPGYIPPTSSDSTPPEILCGFTPILSNIKNKPLPIAHTELIHLQAQIADAFAKQNITDPLQQEKLLNQNFGGNVLLEAHAAYQERPDFFNLTKLFIPIDVPAKTAEILHNSNDYESVFNNFQIITDQVLDNAQLCQMEVAPEIENQLIQSLQIIREPKNNAEFIFHATITDQLLTDIQCQSQAIATATPTVWQKTSEAFIHGMGVFISRFNPITQLTDFASLLGDGLAFGKNRAVSIAKDPIGETQKSIATTLYIIDLIHTWGRLTSDTLYGVHYLSTQECQQRISGFFQNIVILGNIIDKSAENITAKDIGGTIGHILGDIFSAKAFSTAVGFLRQIDAFGKISQEAKAAVQGIKTVIEEHPAYAAAEGAVLKMNNGMKNAGNAFKESAAVKNAIQKVANMKEFFELPFGKTLYPHSLKTKRPYQGVPIYQLVEKAPGSDLKKGFYYYLDKLHGDHIEVFNKRGDVAGVYNLDGTFNSKKFDAAQKAGRNIKDFI